MPRTLPYEVRDPVHGFIAYDGLERAIIDTRPVQRLRHIKQLALTYQLYPGATHTRFEHALGVMHLVGQAFDTILQHAAGDFRDWMGWNDPAQVSRQKRALRLAALLHDVGHAPFSHAGEGLFSAEIPEHEWMTKALIEDPNGEIAQVLATSEHNTFGLKPQDIVPLAVESKVMAPPSFQQGLLASLISGSLGVDRMDYLVRDSHHTGVAYGRFDYQRLLNTLRVTHPGVGPGPQLAIETGGIHAAEGLLLARCFMWLQVYKHAVRQVYDEHLVEFLKEWLPNGVLPTGPDEYLRLDDSTVEAAFRDERTLPSERMRTLAGRLYGRRHFRLATRVSAAERARTDLELGLIDALRAEVDRRFGRDTVRVMDMEVRISRGEQL